MKTSKKKREPNEMREEYDFSGGFGESILKPIEKDIPSKLISGTDQLRCIILLKKMERSCLPLM